MKIKTVKDYIPQILEKFPFLTLKEIEDVLTFGLKRYVKVNKMHADVLFTDPKNNYTAFTGVLGVDRLKHFERFCSKWRMKERMLFKFRKEEWDHYYYIGLTQEAHDKIKNKKTITFKNVYASKIKNEWHHIKWVKHIWRFPAVADRGWKFYIDELTKYDAEYVGPNDYEKYHLCFLGRFGDGYTPVSK